EMLEFVKPLDSVVEVDCYIGGCPPTPEQIYNAFKAIFEGERGWIASGKSVCEFCSRNLAEKLGEVSRFLNAPKR
ncbi:MAG: F420-non-reducing hydrogenase small subunit, partial [Archaeoglobus sp.]|nr:F420-non-reducing hydrogenase small subunit [Archaeoglobus sp.]